MSATQEPTDRAQWDATNAANKDRLLRVIRSEAERLLAYADLPANWEKPTASGHWQVRDIVGHMVDVTEGYLGGFRIAVTENGFAYEAGSIDDLPAVFDFDPSSLILTAYGDQTVADRYRTLFYAI